MMSQHFRLSSEIGGAIAKRLPHAKNQLSAPGCFFNLFVTDIRIYTVPGQKYSTTTETAIQIQSGSLIVNHQGTKKSVHNRDTSY